MNSTFDHKRFLIFANQLGKVSFWSSMSSKVVVALIAVTTTEVTIQEFDNNGGSADGST